MVAFRIFSNLSLMKTKNRDLEYIVFNINRVFSYYSYYCEVTKISMYTVFITTAAALHS